VKRAAFSIAAAVATATLGLVSVAQAAPSAPGAPAAVCGFWKNAQGAYYEHCNSPKVILIRVDRSGGGTENDYCRTVSARRTPLGTAASVDNAYFISSGICPV
jgi:hypothetical protein